MSSAIAELFLCHSVKKLRQSCGDVGECLGRLTADQIWKRGGRQENAIGNLVLHLCGNVRQWICAGIGGDLDIRNRDGEFSSQGGYSAAQLTALLNETVEQAIAIIGGLTPERLVEEIIPQDRQVSVLEAVYQVVGHFQLHTGQIIFATKMQTGDDLKLYKPAPVRPNA